VTEIVISRRAREDFRRIWQYIALDNESAADRLLLAIDVKIESLKRFPELGATRPEIAANVRVLVHGSYIILYEFDRADDTVQIVAIVEGMRDLDNLF
jgi:toxin ParE1/3/4